MEIKKGTIQTSHEKINTSATTFVRQEPIVKEFTGKQPATNELRPSIGKIAKEPIVRAINSIVINNKKLVNCEIDNGILKMDWDQPDWTIDDIKNWKKEVETHFRVIEYDYDRLMLNIFKNQPFEAIIVPSTPKFKIQINPAGGIECFYSRISAKSSVNLGPFSYKLERKKNLGRTRPKLLRRRVTRPAIQQDSTLQSAPQVDIPQGFSPSDSENEYGWKTIAEEKNNVYGFFIYDDKDIEENQSYTYRLTVKDSSTKDTTEYEETILYKRLNIEIIKFEAIPDPLEKKIVLTHQVENSLSVKIYRNGKEIGLIKEDHDVELNGKYEYVLEASNAWETITKTISVTCSNSLLPQKVNLNYETALIDKQVTLKWPGVSNAQKIIIERRLDQEPTWEKINESKTSYIKEDSYIDRDTKLQEISVYVYRVSWINGWGMTSSNISIITGMRPQKPRLRAPMIGWCDYENIQRATIKWLSSKNAKYYEVKRYDYSNSLVFQEIDDNKVTHNKFWQLNASVNYIKDNEIKKDIQYLYKITAKNGWGDSEPCYFDLKIRNEFNGTTSKETPFHYSVTTAIGPHNWTNDFQGITTDGKYWYLTNGSPGTKHVKLRKLSVNESLYSNIDFTYNAPSKKNHFGDLDCYKNYLFIPVTYEDNKKKSEIWIMDKEEMKLIKTVQLFTDVNRSKGVENIGWCAFNPHDGRLYTSSNKVNEDRPVYSYELHLDRLDFYTQFKDYDPDPYCVAVNNSLRKLNLYDSSGNHIKLSAMQGGCFDYYNNLYLSNGCGKDSTNPGIHVFKLIRDENQETLETTCSANSNEINAELYEHYISGDWNRHFYNSRGILIAESSKPFLTMPGMLITIPKFYFDLGESFLEKIFGGRILGTIGTFLSKTFGLTNEAEGIVYYDFAYKVRKPYHNEIKKTSFHASILDNQGLSTDKVQLLNYLHTFRDTEEKNIYYSPSNLKVINDQDQGDYKIVDNGILVKRLRTKLQAECAIKVLNHFKRIHIIGRLHTTSPDHNYEFSALELTKGSIANQLTTWINELEDEQKKAVNLTVIQYDSNNLKRNYDPDTQNNETERYIIYIVKKIVIWKIAYHFCAHNKQDANSIYNILCQYKKICIIGVGPEATSCKYFSDIDYGHQIYSANNLIWLEK